MPIFPEGTSGTLTAELNRLANFGVYPDPKDYLAPQGAANSLAGTSGLGIVAALNYVADPTRQPNNYKDLDGVCNELANTTGLSAVGALEKITNIAEYYLTKQASYYIDATDASASGQTVTNLGAAGSLLPTTLGSSTAADSNDPIFLSHTGTNYVYLPGVVGNNFQVPDSDALDITGDIDVRVWCALDDWTPAAEQTFLSKRAGAGARSYNFNILTDGTIRFFWSTDGTNEVIAVSTVAPTVVDGQPLWVRATLDVDNGAGGYDVKFYTSTDGTTWTQLGATVTGAGTTSIFVSTSVVRIGERVTNTNPIAAKFYRAQVFNGIDGTKVLDVDTSVITAGSATSFTAVTGQTVTINRSTSGRKTVAVTQPTWLFGTDDYMEVNNRYMSSGTYLYLPGVALNTASAADIAAYDITGDLDLRCKVALDDWTPGTAMSFVSKYGAVGARSYVLSVITTGELQLSWTSDGTNAITKTSTVVTGVTDGSTKWVRVTLDVDNGASGNDVKFWLSDDGTTWTQLGDTVTTAGTTSIHSGTASLIVGGFNGGNSNPARGKFFRAQVLNGIDGTVAFDANFETSITSLEQASFTESSANAATVTINRSGSAYRSAGITAAGYLYPGATNTFSASATDFLNHGLNSFSFGLVYRQWITPTGTSRIMFKGTSAGAPIYRVTNNGTTLAVNTSTGDGTATNGRTSSIPSSGNLNEVVFVVNRQNSTVLQYFNNETSASLELTVGSADNPLTLVLGQASGGSSAYADMELVAAYVFRQALTAAQARQITNYFANREVYL